MAVETQELPEAAQAAPDATTMCEAFQATAARDPDAVALRNEDGSVEVTWKGYADRVRAIAAGLAALGVGRGDTVALYLSNRPEFHLVDTAAIHLGAVPFSIYATSAPGQVAHLFENAGCGVVVAEQQFLEKIEAAREKCDGEGPGTIVLIDGEADGAITLDELEAGAADDFDFEAAWAAVEPEDVLTLIYTSGTTGPPKGVQLTHQGMLAQCRDMGEVLPFRPGARITSYLPSAHIADRWSSHYSSMVWGIQITDVADQRAVAKVLPALRPTIWGGVPRVFEKLSAALKAGLAAEEDDGRRRAVQGAIDIGMERARKRSDREAVPDDLEERYRQADEQVLSKLRVKLGLDQAEWIICGAAPLSPEVQLFLVGIGLPLIELYGMSEASCCVSCAKPGDGKIGSVGPIMPSLEHKLTDDGELCIKGPTVMVGYRGDEEKTKEAIDEDGWLHSGDIVEIDDDGFVTIVDRKKELIVNAGGKNMSPANIEQHIKDASPLIGQAIAIGDKRPYNVALIVLDPDAAPPFEDKHGREAVERAVAGAVESANRELARVEQIKRYELLDEEWEAGGDELTPTLKLKRKPIAEKYADVIEALYARAE